MRRQPQRWWLALSLMLALLAGCAGQTAPAATAVPPTAAPTPTPAPAAATATQPPATRPPATSAPAAISPTVRPATPTPPTATRTATPSAGVHAEPWLVEGQPVLQVAIASERQRYVTTQNGLYAVTGNQVEKRASGTDWPNLQATNPTTLVSGDHAPCARGTGGVPLRRSVDGGRTWQPVSVSGGRGVLEARPIPTLAGGVFAVACDGLYHSTDAGATWQRQPLLEPDHEAVDLATTPDGRQLYVVSLFGEGGTTRLQVAERQGAGWSLPRTLRESWGGGIVSVGSDAGRTVVYFATPLGVEISRDAGATWQGLSKGLDTTLLLADPRQGPLPPKEEAKLQRAVGVYSIAPLPQPGRALLGGSDGVYRLRDGRWEKLPVLDSQLVREVFVDLDDTAYARSDLGVFRLRGL